MLEETAMIIIGNYGFPIGMCLWFMFRTEKIIQNNTSTMTKIQEVIEKCQKK